MRPPGPPPPPPPPSSASKPPTVTTDGLRDAAQVLRIEAEDSFLDWSDTEREQLSLIAKRLYAEADRRERYNRERREWTQRRRGWSL